MTSQTLNEKLSIWETGVTSAAVPVKKQPSKLDISSGFIFLSITFIPLDFAISIIHLLVIPFKKESAIGGDIYYFIHSC